MALASCRYDNVTLRIYTILVTQRTRVVPKRILTGEVTRNPNHPAPRLESQQSTANKFQAQYHSLGSFTRRYTLVQSIKFPLYNISVTMKCRDSLPLLFHHIRGTIAMHYFEAHRMGGTKALGLFAWMMSMGVTPSFSNTVTAILAGDGPS